MSKLRIAGYLRISVDTEVDKDSTSIENQRKIIKKYVADKFPNCALDFYTDRDRSGYTFEQREDYQRMRPLLINGYYKILIIKDLSRFSRRNSRGLVELEDLRDAGVRIIAVTDGIDYPTYDEWQNIQVRFLINEFPITDASKKVKSVIDSRQKDGKWICAVPYGYYITNTKNMTYTVDESAANVVRKVFELYLGGWGYKKIANYLTDQKIPTPRMVEKERKEADGKTITKIKASPIWSIPTISGILANDFYIGTLRQKKYTRTKINGAEKKLEESEHRVFEKAHEAIIDPRTFAKVQEQLKSRTKSNYRGIKKYDTTYSGFLFCGDCGSPMFSMSRPDLAPAYTCGTYHKRGLKGCTSHHTKTDLLDVMIKKYIERVMINSKTMIAELERAIKDEPKRIKQSHTTLEKLEVELARAKEEYKANKRIRNRDIAKAEDLIDDPIKLERKINLIHESYDEIEAELENKIDGLEKQIELATEQRNMTIQVNRISKNAIDIFREILVKPKLDKGDLSLIIERITVYEDNIEIQLKADISMLLETGTVSKDILEQSSFVGTTVNFKWDTKSISNATVVQKSQKQKDKAFSVNVICEGDPLEIYTDSDGEVIFKKYSPIGELGPYTKQYVDVLGRTTGLPVVICDRDHIIAVSGMPKKDIIGKRISPMLESYMERRANYVLGTDKDNLVISEELPKAVCAMSPIIGGGDVMGAVVLMAGDRAVSPGQTEVKLVQVAAGFLGKQMEE